MRGHISDRLGNRALPEYLGAWLTYLSQSVGLDAGICHHRVLTSKAGVANRGAPPSHRGRSNDRRSRNPKGRPTRTVQVLTLRPRAPRTERSRAQMPSPAEPEGPQDLTTRTFRPPRACQVDAARGCERGCELGARRAPTQFATEQGSESGEILTTSPVCGAWMKLPAADVHAHVATPPEEHELAGRQLVLGHRHTQLVLGSGRSLRPSSLTTANPM